MSKVRKLLIVKTSSLGDVVHMLPAITDAAACMPGLQIDWVVEESFADVPAWHPAINRVIPVALRRWRKQLLQARTWQEIRAFMASLREQQYDWVLDTQGLLKSALLTRLVHGEVHGYERHSIREPFASLLYSRKHTVSRQLHAITRNRELTAVALGYSLDGLALDHGIAQAVCPAVGFTFAPPYVMALHGTSRPDKEWPEAQWQLFLQAMEQRGCHVFLPWGNQREKERAERLAATSALASVLPHCNLSELAALICHATGVIGMDTGLMHIAAALGKPGVALYPVTLPELTGVTMNSHAENCILSLDGQATTEMGEVIHQFLTVTGIA